MNFETTGQDQVKEQTKDQDPWRQFVNEQTPFI